MVRLYGYCLQPPVVCLILELLPSSLDKVLYHNKVPDLPWSVVDEATTPGLIATAEDRDTVESARSTGMSTRHLPPLGSTIQRSGRTHNNNIYDSPKPGEDVRLSKFDCSSSRSARRSGRHSAPLSLLPTVSSILSCRLKQGTFCPVGFGNALLLLRDISAALAYMHDYNLHGGQGKVVHRGKSGCV